VRGPRVFVVALLATAHVALVDVDGRVHARVVLLPRAVPLVEAPGAVRAGRGRTTLAGRYRHLLGFLFSFIC
jgi:hypothetical protein